MATVTHLTTAQPVGAYLTTAMQSNAGSNFVQANAVFNGTNASGTIASNAISVSVNPQTAFVFSNSNGVSFGTNGSTVTASVQTNYLTTAALSNHSHNFATTTTNGALIVVGTTNSNGVTIGVPSFLTTAQPVGAYLTTARASTDAVGLNTAQSNVTWTVNSSGISVDARGYAGTGFTGTNISGTVNSNGIQLSANVGGGGDGYNIIAVGGSTANSTGTIVFSNSNGVSFGLNGATVTATVATNYQSQGAYLTTARASNDAIGLNTALTGNGVSVTANSSGLSINVPAFLTTAALSNHSHGNPTLNLTNISGTTASNSAGLTLSLSGNAAQSAQPVAASGSNGSFNFSTLSFGNLNGLSFYTSNGSIVGSYTDGGGGGGAGTNTALNLTNLTGTLSVNTNGVSLSLSGNGAGGGGGTFANWEPFPAGNNTTFSSMGQNSFYLQKLRPEANYSFNNFEVRASGSFVSSSNSQRVHYTVGYGLYSLNGATYSSISTSQMNIQVSYNSSTAMGITVSQGAGSYTVTSNNSNVASYVSGFKHLYLPFTSTITAGGEYALGLLISSASTVGTSPYRLAVLNHTVINNLTIGKIYASTISVSNASFVGDFAMGVGSVTTGAMPSSIANTALTNQVSQARLYMQLD